MLPLDLDWLKVENFLIENIRKYAKKLGNKKAIIDFSKDDINTLLTITLIGKAIGSDNILLINIISGRKGKDIRNIKEFLDHTGIPYSNIDNISLIPIWKVYRGVLNPKIELMNNITYMMKNLILKEKSVEYNAFVVGSLDKTDILIRIPRRYYSVWVDILPLGDLYKSQVYKLIDVEEIAYPKIDSEAVEEDLNIDSILYLYHDRKLNKKEILNLGYDAELVEKIIERYNLLRHENTAPYILRLTLPL